MEKYLAAISSHPGNEENKSSTSEKNGKKRKGISKLESEDPTDMESMHRMIKHFSSEVINLKKSNGERKKLSKPFLNKITNINTSPQIPPTFGISLEDYAMDIFCRSHHANH